MFHRIAILALCLVASPPTVGGTRTAQRPAWGQNQRHGEEYDGNVSPHGTDKDQSDGDGGTLEEDVYALPRVEIQFSCGHDIRPDFNASRTVQQFYVDEFLSAAKDYNPHALTFQMYEAVSISDVHDVAASQWFYPLCNQSSTDVLATMEVTGYVGVPGEGNDDYYALRSGRDKNATWYVVEHLIRRVHEGQLEDYFHEHVCQGDDLLFFHVMIHAWSGMQTPTDQPYHHQKSFWNTTGYPSTNNPYYFNHNLYLLCGGKDDYLLSDGEEGPDSTFVVLGLVVGMIMVCMLCSELKSPSSQRTRPRGTLDGYVARPTQENELEMVPGVGFY
jgi:hypothetical protein